MLRSRCSHNRFSTPPHLQGDFSRAMYLGGGGPSGEIGFPTYVEGAHKNWLWTGSPTGPPETNIDQDMVESMNAAFTMNSGNPYVDLNRPSAALHPSPDTDIAAVQTRFDSFDVIVAAMAEETDWDSIVDNAIAKVDSTVIPTADISSAVDAFEARAVARHMRSVSRFTGGMADINAVMSSQFVMGLALLESELEQEVDKFEADLTLDQKKIRSQLVDAGVREMINLMELKNSAHLAAIHSLYNLKRMKIVAEGEESRENLEIDTKEALWDMEVFQYGANLLAAPGGGTAITKPMELTKGQSVLGGAATGASIGHSILPGWGTAIGAGVGAILGAI